MPLDKKKVLLLLSFRDINRLTTEGDHFVIHFVLCLSVTCFCLKTASVVASACFDDDEIFQGKLTKRREETGQEMASVYFPSQHAH